MLSPFFILIPILLKMGGCEVAQNHSEEKTAYTFQEGYIFPYNFKNPDTTFILPNELLEISGLSNYAKDTKLASIQDEKGFVYILNKETGAIEEQFEFFSDGDYEGIEFANDTLFVVKSKGDIFQIAQPGTDSQKVKIYETRLNKTANVEGLGFDAAHQKLLLACKGSMKNSDNTEAHRSIYGFDLKTHKLDSVPIITIDYELIQTYLQSDVAPTVVEKLKEKFDAASGAFSFGPSGIAVHPISKNIYLISSVGKMLMVLSSTGKIIYIEKFNKKQHPQPEGICIDKNGTLWIANEGNESQPILIKYTFQTN